MHATVGTSAHYDASVGHVTGENKMYNKIEEKKTSCSSKMMNVLYLWLGRSLEYQVCQADTIPPANRQGDAAPV